MLAARSSTVRASNTHAPSYPSRCPDRLALTVRYRSRSAYRHRKFHRVARQIDGAVAEISDTYPSIYISYATLSKGARRLRGFCGRLVYLRPAAWAPRFIERRHVKTPLDTSKLVQETRTRGDPQWQSSSLSAARPFNAARVPAGRIPDARSIPVEELEHRDIGAPECRSAVATAMAQY
jgi:hypothetical protein